MTEDVRMLAVWRSECFCPDRGRLRDFVGEILEFARSVPRDALLDSLNDEFYIRVKYTRPETEAEREQRIDSERASAEAKRRKLAYTAEKEIAQMESLMLKYKDIAKIKMRNIEECVSVK